MHCYSLPATGIFVQELQETFRKSILSGILVLTDEAGGKFRQRKNHAVPMLCAADQHMGCKKLYKAAQL
jgi:hypothetical protein